MDIASTLKEFRRENELEQEDLAKLLDTTQQTISNWESGTMPRAGALRRINHLLSTYKKGEGAPRYSPPNAPAVEVGQGGRHGGVHPTMSATMVQPEELEVRRKIAQSLGDIVDDPIRGVPDRPRDRYVGHSYAGLPSFHFRRAMIEHLPKDLVFREDAPIDYPGLRLEIDYSTDNVCAEFRSYNIQGAWSATSIAAYQLATARKIHELSNTLRKHYVLVLTSTVAINPHLQMRLNSISQAAALHGVLVVASSDPAECAAFLAQLERPEEEETQENAEEDADRAPYSW